MKTIIVSLLFLLCGPTMEWKLDFKAAKTEAVATHKMILLNFSGSDWCGPCIKLKKDVFESAEFEAYASQNLVLLRADFPRQKKNQLPKEQVALNEALAEQYNPKGTFPLTVLLDEKGKVVREWEGYQPSVSGFIGEISKAGGTK
ncbi:thioredoxin family protein [Salmonirosea aquatica]|uniref:Thioredoxin fold domain-containing protein n=1 Tax=Salmonirosea aquatica TaxID=2654236 RepID=A0A7C9B9L4_9BACT|nr:thioredoxin fold domain-containing protein [Cytophagaceae bacterium SJW1-29]